MAKIAPNNSYEPVEVKKIKAKIDAAKAFAEGEDLTLDLVRKVMPPKTAKLVNQRFVNTLNALIDEPEERKIFRENFLSYAHVMRDHSGISVKRYVNAVRYVSYKLMGMTNQEAWIKSFPDRYQKMLDGVTNINLLGAVVHQYAKSKVVMTLMEQTMVPHYVLNQDFYQQALNVQVTLMNQAKSEKVRSDAADSVMRHLTPPEASRVDFNVTVKEDESIKELRAATLKLVEEQRKAIAQKRHTAREVAEAKIIPGEVQRIAREG